LADEEIKPIRAPTVLAILKQKRFDMSVAHLGPTGFFIGFSYALCNGDFDAGSWA